MKNLYRTLLIAGAVMMTAGLGQMRVKAEGTHNISVDCSGEGEASVNPTSAEADETITVTANPSDEYYYDGYTVASDSTKHSGTTFTMIDEDVELHVIFTQYEQKNVSVTVSGGGGSATATSSEGTGKARRGQTVTLTATPESNYVFDKWESSDVDLSSATANPATFSMPDRNVSVTAKFKSSSNSGVEHTITVNFNDRYGEANATPNHARAGEEIILLAHPHDGYFFDRWTTGDDIVIGDSEFSEADFRMIDRDVTVIAHFKEDTSDRNKESESSSHHHSDSAPASSDGDKAKSPDGCDDLREAISKAITAAIDNSVPTVAAGDNTSGDYTIVHWNQGDSLPLDVMKMLHDNPQITLIFTITDKNGIETTLNIPGSAVTIFPTVEWYGPELLKGLYGPKPTVNLQTRKTKNTAETNASYTVQAGDTLSKIAKRLGTTVKKLKEQNNLTNVDKIKPGMVLKYNDPKKAQEDNEASPAEGSVGAEGTVEPPAGGEPDNPAGESSGAEDTHAAMMGMGAGLAALEQGNAFVNEALNQVGLPSGRPGSFAQTGGGSMRQETG